MFGCFREVRMAIRATGLGRQRNDRSRWFSARLLSDGGCIEADIVSAPAPDLLRKFLGRMLVGV